MFFLKLCWVTWVQSNNGSTLGCFGACVGFSSLWKDDWIQVEYKSRWRSSAGPVFYTSIRLNKLVHVSPNYSTTVWNMSPAHICHLCPYDDEGITCLLGFHLLAWSEISALPPYDIILTDSAQNNDCSRHMHHSRKCIMETAGRSCSRRSLLCPGNAQIMSFHWNK